MCGIAGLFDLEGRQEIEDALLRRMNKALFHRGPDDCGLHVEPGLGLAHRRLSIIDLSKGHQPLFNEDGTVAVVYNGEIYNYVDLMQRLKNQGHEFRTRCDTEVLVHAWEEWGEGCVERLRGMFAFALWDRKIETLFLARDRLGIKPLYYAYLPGGLFIFASELKALLLHPDLPHEIEPRSVEDFFAYGYVPEPRTIFQHAYKLPPGHTLTMSRGGSRARTKEYWDVSFQPYRIGSEEDVERELIHRLREAIEMRLVADVPLGAFLSGGVDSSAVVSLMADVSSGPVNTCSISFGNPSFNEAHYAAKVAQRNHTNHRVDRVDPDDLELIGKLTDIYDEPFADSSAMPTYRVCELARRQVKVALSGDGGDENFAGYTRYRWHIDEERVRAFLPQEFLGPLFGFLGWIYPKANWAPKPLRAKATLQALAKKSLEAYFHSVSVLGDRLRRELFSARFRSELQGYDAIEVLRAHAVHAPEHPLSRVQYLDFKTYLVGDILTKVDRASMANSLEVRVPLLDHELVEWVSRLPPDLKLRGREGKYVFKRALRPHVDEEILYRRKMGFAVPLSSWFCGPLRDRVRETVKSETLADSGLFNMDFLRDMVDRHQAGSSDYSAGIWSILIFENWLRRKRDGA